MTDRSTVTLAVALGAVLVALGVGAYVLSNFASVTALVPAVFGALVVVLGVVGRRNDRQRLAVYGIGLLAVVGIAGSARGLPDVIALVTGGSVESTVAAVAQGGTILVCLALLAVVATHLLDGR